MSKYGLGAVALISLIVGLFFVTPKLAASVALVAFGVLVIGVAYGLGAAIEEATKDDS